MNLNEATFGQAQRTLLRYVHHDAKEAHASLVNAVLLNIYIAESCNDDT